MNIQTENEMKENKMYYDAPEVEVIEMMVEQGFAASGDGGTDNSGEGGII